MNIEKENKQLKEAAKLAADASFKLSEQVYSLKAENERLKRENEIITGMCNSSSKRFDKLYHLFQEIKAIAERPNPYIDNFEIKTATEVGYDYAAICNELELRLHKVLELITKAEEE